MPGNEHLKHRDHEQMVETVYQLAIKQVKVPVAEVMYQLMNNYEDTSKEPIAWELADALKEDRKTFDPRNLDPEVLYEFAGSSRESFGISEERYNVLMDILCHLTDSSYHTITRFDAWKKDYPRLMRMFDQWDDEFVDDIRSIIIDAFRNEAFLQNLLRPEEEMDPSDDEGDDEFYNQMMAVRRDVIAKLESDFDAVE